MADITELGLEIDTSRARAFLVLADLLSPFVVPFIGSAKYHERVTDAAARLVRFRVESKPGGPMCDWDRAGG